MASAHNQAGKSSVALVKQLHSGAESNLRGAVNCLPPNISAHSIMPGFIWVLCSFLSFNIEDDSGAVPKLPLTGSTA